MFEEEWLMFLFLLNINMDRGPSVVLIYSVKSFPELEKKTFEGRDKLSKNFQVIADFIYSSRQSEMKIFLVDLHLRDDLQRQFPLK